MQAIRLFLFEQQQACRLMISQHLTAVY